VREALMLGGALFIRAALATGSRRSADSSCGGQDLARAGRRGAVCFLAGLPASRSSVDGVAGVDHGAGGVGVDRHFHAVLAAAGPGLVDRLDTAVKAEAKFIGSYRS